MHFHQGTAEAIAEVILLDGASEFARVNRRSRNCGWIGRVLVLPGDRFILRQFSPVVTIGGGTVLDARAARHKRKDAGVVARFWKHASAATTGNSWRAGWRSRRTRVTFAEIVARTGWTDAEMARGGAKATRWKNARVILAAEAGAGRVGPGGG